MILVAAMKSRHAAALALVGWYLMVPPYTENVFRCDLNAPLTKWRHFKSLDSESACKDLRDRYRGEEHRDSPLWYAFDNSVCISSDDQRLKPK